MSEEEKDSKKSFLGGSGAIVAIIVLSLLAVSIFLIKFSIVKISIPGVAGFFNGPYSLVVFYFLLIIVVALITSTINYRLFNKRVESEAKIIFKNEFENARKSADLNEIGNKIISSLGRIEENTKANYSPIISVLNTINSKLNSNSAMQAEHLSKIATYLSYIESNSEAIKGIYDEMKVIEESIKENKGNSGQILEIVNQMKNLADEVRKYE